MSDIHVGSKYCLVAQIRDFVRIAWGRGVRQILVPGDLLDGCYPHGRWELKYHGFQEQVAALENVLPSKPGLDYYGIAGNHDETFERDSGMVSYINIEDYFVSHGRKDMHMLGSRGAYVRLRTNSHHRGLVVHLWHPTRARAYALSYQLQKQVERYSPGLKPDILLAGHWHQSCYCAIRGVHALSCGTFQGGGSAYGKSLGGSPTIGGWIIEYAMTSDGTIRSFRPEWVGYFEKETVREVMI
jgi:UDP-2,3-diacylglucosamine pyrophosphatase LpxH